MRSPFRSKKALAWFALAMFVLLAAADQLLHRVVLEDGQFLGRRVAPYDPPLFSAEQRGQFQGLCSKVGGRLPLPEGDLHDPVLGWCTPRGASVGDDLFDLTGARTPPNGRRELAPETVCIVTVGCSFTLCTEVSNDKTWQVALEKERADLACVNLGVMGYGMDQAVLRYERDGLVHEPDEVWLGFFPSSSLRVTSMYRPALRHWGRTILFKPRFLFDQWDELELVPNPGATLVRTQELIGNQALFLQATRADAWVSRFPAAWMPRGSSWLHHSGLARIALTGLEHRGRDPLAALRDPQSEAWRLSTALTLRLRAAAAETGSRFRLLILPGPSDLEDYRARGRASWADWTAALVQENVEVIDLTSCLDEGDRREPGALWAPNGHYTATGNAWVAEELARHVKNGEGV